MPAWAFTSAAFAADAATTPSSSNDAAIGEIIVTAEKRSESLTDTPIAINVLSADKLAHAGVTNIYDIATVTPGMRMDLVGTNLQPTIRGVTSATSGTGNSPNVAIYVDGYYQPSNLSNNLELADITQIEVLKGPQGTLFGRNATGGAILVTTAAPSFVPRGKFEAGYGSDNDIRLSGFISGPILDKLAISLEAINRSYDGFSTNIFTGHKDGLYDGTTLRGKLLYKPSDDLSITLSLRDSTTHDGAGRVYRIPLPIGADTQGFFIPGTVVATQPFTNSQDLQPKSNTDVQDGGITVVGNLGFATLTSYSGFQNEQTYQQTDLDGTSAAISDITTTTNTNVLSQEFNLNSNSTGVLKWTAGANYFYDRDAVPTYYVATQTAPHPANSRNAKIITNAEAIFADATYEFLSKWYLTGGLRYSTENKQFISDAATSRLIDVNHTWDSLTPRVNLRYQFDPDSSAYASYSKGFKAGTYNVTTPVNAPVNPEKISAYEIGYKLSRHGIVWNSSAYYYLYSDMQVSAYDFSVAVPVTKLQNVGKATIYGADTDVSWVLDDNFDVVFDLAWTHGRYDSFPGAQGYLPNANGIGYRTLVVDASGNKMIRTPDWTASFTGNFTYPTEYGTLRLSAHPYFTSSFFSEAPNEYRIPSYTLLDLTASWTLPNNHWTATIMAKNVTNKYYVYYWDPTGSALMVNDGAPRFIRGSISYKF